MILQEFCPENRNFLEGASDSVLTMVAEMFDKLEYLEQINEGLLLKEPAELFQPIRQNHKLFKNGIHNFRLKIQKKLKDVLPNVLAGILGDEELLKILGNNELRQMKIFRRKYYYGDDLMTRIVI